jgi:hypothetical protein
MIQVVNLILHVSDFLHENAAIYLAISSLQMWRQDARVNNIPVGSDRAVADGKPKVFTGYPSKLDRIMLSALLFMILNPKGNFDLLFAIQNISI